MDNELAEYRKYVIETQKELNHSYDKLLVTLSGGALALSITFLKDIASVTLIITPNLLIMAWSLFIISLASILGEILFGIEAHKKTVRQIDAMTIYDEKAGGKPSVISKYLHWLSALTLVTGLLLISIFAFNNLGEKNNGTRTETNPTIETNTA